jgi:hypothetical protein
MPIFGRSNNIPALAVREVPETPFEDYYHSFSEMSNFIISGGHIHERVSAIYALLLKAVSFGLPTIVIHSGNPYLAPKPLSIACQTEIVEYEPAFNKSSSELADILTDVAVNALGADKRIFVLIHLVIDIIEATRQTVTLMELLSFPCDQVLAELRRLTEAGKLTPEGNADFTKRYGGIASECTAETSRLFSRLRNFWKRQAPQGRQKSFHDIVAAGGIITFDLLSDTNTVVKEMCFADIDFVLQQGKRFLLVVDGVSLNSQDESHINSVLLRNHSNISVIYSAIDVPQVVLQNETDFYTLVGGNANLVLFKHNNAHSAQLWSGFFGQEWAAINETSVGKSKENIALFKSTNTETLSTRYERIDRLPPEMLLDIPYRRGMCYLADVVENGATEFSQMCLPMLVDNRIKSVLGK